MFYIDFICLPHILQGKNYHVRVFGTLNSLCHPGARGPRKNECFCGVHFDHGMTQKRIARTKTALCTLHSALCTLSPSNGHKEL